MKIQTTTKITLNYTDHAGPEIPVDLGIASRISGQIASNNAGPTSAIKSMGTKLSLRCHLLNIEQ